MNLNTVHPNHFIIVDITPQFHWTLAHKLNARTTRIVMEIIVRCYPEANILDDIWTYIDKEIDVQNMSVVQLENLEFELEQLCHQVDSYIHSLLTPYEYSYYFVQWIEPWGVVMEYRDRYSQYGGR